MTVTIQITIDGCPWTVSALPPVGGCQAVRVRSAVAAVVCVAEPDGWRCPCHGGPG